MLARSPFSTHCDPRIGTPATDYYAHAVTLFPCIGRPALRRLNRLFLARIGTELAILQDDLPALAEDDLQHFLLHQSLPLLRQAAPAQRCLPVSILSQCGDEESNRTKPYQAD